MYFELKNISVHYDKVQALENVTLHVEQMEIVALIGANGAGKTSTLRAITARGCDKTDSVPSSIFSATLSPQHALRHPVSRPQTFLRGLKKMNRILSVPLPIVGSR